MNVSNMSHLFSKSPFANNALSRNKQLPGQGNTPANALQKISNQMIAEQENSNKETDQIKLQLRMDTFTKTTDSSDEERAKVILRLYHHMTTICATGAKMREADLMSFKEHLEGMDQKIQYYQDVLDGKATLSEDSLFNDVECLLNVAKQQRVELIAEGVERFKKGGAYFEGCLDNFATKVFGENPLAGMHASDWEIDVSAPDLYAEIDRVLENTHTLKDKLYQSADYISDELEIRGYSDPYVSKGWKTEWSTYRGYYDQQADAMQREMERLRNSLVYTASEGLEPFINPLEK